MKVKRIKISEINHVENSRADSGKKIQDLMSSIQKDGLLEPIGVNYEKTGTYTIMYGNRRLEAVTKLGWTTIPAVLHSGLDVKDFHIKNMIENVQRENISPVEVGRICDNLIRKEKMTLGEIAVRLNYSESTLKSLMHVYTELPESIRDKVTFHKRGMKRAGTFTVSNVIKVLNVRGETGLGRSDLNKLLEYSRVNELSNEDIKIVSYLMKEGLKLNQALERRNDYRSYRIDVIAIRDEVDSLAKKENIPTNSYMSQIFYGLKSPVTKPNFISFTSKRNGKSRE